MSLTSKNSGGGYFELVPEGTHLARCYLMVDIGYQETANGTKLQVVFGFEIPGELIDGKPIIIYRVFTNSMHKKSHLRACIESWRGKKLTEEESQAFDLRKVLGHPCQLSVVHRDVGEKTYANIAAITGLPKGLPVAPQVNESICFDLDTDGNTSLLPQWLQKKVAGAGTGTELDNFGGLDHPDPAIDDKNDDAFFDDTEIPF